MKGTEIVTNAVRALEALALGHTPDRALALSAALALDALEVQSIFAGDANRDLLDTARILRTLATGVPVELDIASRARAAALARMVRELPEDLSCD